MKLSIINDIRNLSEAIQKQCDMMSVLSENNHTDGLGKTLCVMVKRGEDDWWSVKASDQRPQELRQMSDDLCDFIVEHRADFRPITTSPGAVIGEDGDWVMSRAEIREAA